MRAPAARNLLRHSKDENLHAYSGGGIVRLRFRVSLLVTLVALLVMPAQSRTCWADGTASISAVRACCRTHCPMAAEGRARACCRTASPRPSGTLAATVPARDIHQTTVRLAISSIVIAVPVDRRGTSWSSRILRQSLLRRPFAPARILFSTFLI